MTFPKNPVPHKHTTGDDEKRRVICMCRAMPLHPSHAAQLHPTVWLYYEQIAVVITEMGGLTPLDCLDHRGASSCSGTRAGGDNYEIFFARHWCLNATQPKGLLLARTKAHLLRGLAKQPKRSKRGGDRPRMPTICATVTLATATTSQGRLMKHESLQSVQLL